MSNVVIDVENVSKQYRLGTVGTGTLSHDLNRLWHRVRGKEDPYLKLGETNDRTLKANSDYVWALRDINFGVNQGEILGILGRNGAGKSTLLKILSKVTGPTTGSISIKGRIASLLEVGTGFHPELTGRENIFLNGAILGMSKTEIKSKFDEIVDFSGVERYIDTPVKRYSSGMYVRLAFAVAAHLEPEILIVDEVLAVGDAEFQKKCLGKMSDVSAKDGRTVLFVSHNIVSIKKLCNRGLLLERGQVAHQGDIIDVVARYTRSDMPKGELGSVFNRTDLPDSPFYLKSGSVHDERGINTAQYDADEDIYVDLAFVKKAAVIGLYGYVVVKNTNEEVFIESDTLDYSPNVLDNEETGEFKYELKIPKRLLPVGEYRVYLNFSATGKTIDSPRDILSFTVSDTTTSRAERRQAATSYTIKWIKK